jgi:hypothetical protein
LGFQLSSWIPTEFQLAPSTKLLTSHMLGDNAGLVQRWGVPHSALLPGEWVSMYVEDHVPAPMRSERSPLAEVRTRDQRCVRTSKAQRSSQSQAPAAGRELSKMGSQFAGACLSTCPRRSRRRQAWRRCARPSRRGGPPCRAERRVGTIHSLVRFFRGSWRAWDYLMNPLKDF